jgi:hypothetical protein
MDYLTAHPPSEPGFSRTDPTAHPQPLSREGRNGLRTHSLVAPARSVSPHTIVVVHFHRSDLVRFDYERSILSLGH